MASYPILGMGAGDKNGVNTVPTLIPLTWKYYDYVSTFSTKDP